MSLGEISALLAMIAAIPYLHQVFKGGVKPERASWFVWTTLLIISFFSQQYAGGDDSLGLIVGDIIATATILGVSLFKGTGGFSRFDITCLVLAFVGVAIWQLADLPVVAISAVVFADAMGSLPTIRKAFFAPQSESRISFSITATAALFGVMAVGSWNIALLVYPAYILLVNVAVVVACEIGYKIGNHMKVEQLD